MLAGSVSLPWLDFLSGHFQPSRDEDSPAWARQRRPTSPCMRMYVRGEAGACTWASGCMIMSSRAGLRISSRKPEWTLPPGHHAMEGIPALAGNWTGGPVGMCEIPSVQRQLARFLRCHATNHAMAANVHTPPNV